MLSLFLPIIVLLVAGLTTIASISIHLFWLQLIWLVIGTAFVFLFLFVDWRFILNYRWLIGGFYVLVVLLLVFVYLKGPVIRNTRSWLVLGPIRFEPVELVKVALIMLYANYFSRRHLSIARWQNIITSFIFFALPAGLVALQPDLGSALILFGIWFGFLLVSGLPMRRVVASFLLFFLVGIFMWFFVLKNYQRERIVGVFYPERNALGINYSMAQSKITIGSAGLWGKGYSEGSQTQLGFLTEPATDFILAAFIEERGIIGGFIILGFFLILISEILKIAARAERNFERFICLGGAITLGLQFLLNAGSETGLTPVIGVTFPFLSYGGSSLISNFFILSLINAISRKNK